MGEEDVGQLALRVGSALVVALLAVDVIKVDGARPGVSVGRYIDDPGWRRFLNQVNQQICEQEVAWRTR